MVEALEAALRGSPVGNTGTSEPYGTKWGTFQRGVDTVGIRVEIAPECGERLRSFDSRPAYAGRVRLGHVGSFGKFEKLLGKDVLWNESTGRVWVEWRPAPENFLWAADRLSEAVEDVLKSLSVVGLHTWVAPAFARIDYAVDVVAPDPAVGKALMTALRYARTPARRHTHAPVVEPETVYVKRGKRSIAAAYDKGRQRELAVGNWRYLRLEARWFGNGSDVLALEDATEDFCTTVWKDRFLTLSGGLSVTRGGGSVMVVKELLEDGEVEQAEALKLIGYLELEERGMAEELLSPHYRARMRRKAADLRIGNLEPEARENLDLEALLQEFIA